MADYFDKDNYVGVHERIAKFREEHKQGMITTFREKGEGGEYFKAVVFRNQEEAKLYPSLAAASGHADIVENGKKASEKAETVAIGRALAILGYEVKKGLASAEEMESFQERNNQESKPSRFGRSEDKEEAKEDKKNNRFNRPQKEKAEEKVDAPAEEEEAPKASRFAARQPEAKEEKKAAPAKEEAAEESSNEESSDEKPALRSSRPFKSGSRFTRGGA
jgi:hypothetical protein